MDTNFPRRLRDKLAHREDFIRVVVIGSIIALGVNLIASGIFILIPASRPIALSIGLILVTGGLLYLSKFIFGERRIGVDFIAFLIFDPIEKSLVPVREYEFSNEIYRTVRASFLENKALETIWEKEPLAKERFIKEGQGEKDEKDTGENLAKENVESSDRKSEGYSFVTVTRYDVDECEKMPEPKSASILREAIEFAIIERLSLTLSGYFQNYPDDDKYIKEYIREDVPFLLLQNRILSLLTTPLENRAVFVNQNFEKHPEGEVTLVLGSDGAMYRRFNLVLPKNTSISRPNPGVLHFENERLELTLTTFYEGFWTNLPKDFIGYYVGYDPDRVVNFQIKIKVDAKIKPWSLFRARGWNYFRWVDSFAEAVEEFASRESFFKRINWDALSAHLYVINRQKVMKRRALMNQHEVEKKDTAS
jgi:hypothetical protein